MAMRHMGPVAHIYFLFDPRDRVPRYVGLSAAPAKRLLQHCALARKRQPRTRLALWIQELAARGVSPEMELLETWHIPARSSDLWDSAADARFAEQWWMWRFLTAGHDLLNARIGLSYGGESFESARERLIATGEMPVFVERA